MTKDLTGNSFYALIQNGDVDEWLEFSNPTQLLFTNKIDEVFPLQETRAAFDKMGQANQFGKLVLTIPSEAA